jgi:hypothetical protein
MRIESHFIDMEFREILVPVSRYRVSRMVRHPFFHPVFIDKPGRVFGVEMEYPYDSFQQQKDQKDVKYEFKDKFFHRIKTGNR